MPLPHLNALRELARVYRLRALAELAAGKTDAALDDVQTCLRLADALQDEPLLISSLVRMALLDIAIQPVWEGLVTHRWDGQELAVLERDFARVDQWENYARAMRGERILAYQIMVSLRDHPEALPVINSLTSTNTPLANPNWFGRRFSSVFFYRNELNLDRLYTEKLLPTVNGQERSFDPQADTRIEQASKSERLTLYNVMSKLLYSGITTATRKFAFSQFSADAVRVACALERYRLAQGRYPESLDALVPRFIGSLPHDVILGGPLRYHLRDDDQYVLYSIGWNGVDDGGTIAWTNAGHPSQDQTQGDWVWFSQPQPQPSASERK
jgi:hypothetical protein